MALYSLPRFLSPYMWHEGHPTAKDTCAHLLRLIRLFVNSLCTPKNACFPRRDQAVVMGLETSKNKEDGTHTERKEDRDQQVQHTCDLESKRTGALLRNQVKGVYLFRLARGKHVTLAKNRIEGMF